jgi:DNA-nicking Smr family endonuclease
MSDNNEFKKYCEENRIVQIQQNQKRIDPIVKPKTSKLYDQNFENISVQSSLVSSFIEQPQYSEYDCDINTPDQFCNNGQNLLMRELGRPSLSINLVLDFHGYTANEAITALQQVINNYSNRVIIRIIHGKGLNSNNNKPVLKHVIRKFLMRNPRLLAYSSAHNNQGGAGATCCCFRAQR